MGYVAFALVLVGYTVLAFQMDTVTGQLTSGVPTSATTLVGLGSLLGIAGALVGSGRAVGLWAGLMGVLYWLRFVS